MVCDKVIFCVEVGFISSHLPNLSTLLGSVSKLSGRVVSTQKTKYAIVGTTDDLVKLIYDANFILKTGREDWVTPATKMPMIRMTIDSSISEKALLLLVIFNLSFNKENNIKLIKLMTNNCGII